MQIKLNIAQMLWLKKLMFSILWSEKESKESKCMAGDILNKLKK